MRISIITAAVLRGVAALAASSPAVPQNTYGRNIRIQGEGEHPGDTPPPPEPEPIKVHELPLPPVTSNTDEGSCTPEINPHKTGCIGQSVELQSGGFLPDGKHVAATVQFAGAPADPDPASIYTGKQVIIVKTDGTAFPNGDPWKCITCGVPEENAVGRTDALDYPDSFNDGKRLLAGTNIIDCGTSQLASPSCTSKQIHIFPIRFNVNPDGSGPGGSIRELRLHPDNLHLGYSSFAVTAGRFNQYGYIGRLEFNPSPQTGEPLAPRYDLTNVTLLLDPDGKPPLSVNPHHDDQLELDLDAIALGELRSFSKDGREVTYVGYPAESSNIDLFAADLTTGKVRRLTSHPGYTDPVDLSPDNQWTVVMDTRGSNRQMFVAGMRGIPPITDQITSSTTSSVRNNGQRRFFQPFLIDRYGDRYSYFGQKINAEGDGSPGSINDPEWNGMADPKWSPDGTRIVYWQHLTVPPACGGHNPLPCEPSTEPGGRTERMMIAHLTSRKTTPATHVKPVPDTTPWGTPYEPGMTPSPRPYPPGGTYTLEGKVTGSAEVVITENSNKTAVNTVEVTYHSYSDHDEFGILNGTEKVTVQFPSPTLNNVDWYSDLTQTIGGIKNTKKTSPDGFHLAIDTLTNIFQANGTLTTTIDGQLYTQPANGT